MASVPVPIAFEPGIQRDNTRLASARCIDGEWVRWGPDGKPRKMRGWKTLTTVQGIPRGLHQYTQNGEAFLHIGTPNSLARSLISTADTATVPLARTPSSGLVADDLNIWHMEVIKDGVSGDVTLFAQALPTGASIDTTTLASIFYGDVSDTGPLTELVDGSSNPIQSDGGFFVLHPYLFLLNSGGVVEWSVPGSPTDFAGTGSGTAAITSQKLIAGRQSRGSASASPSGLIWSSDRLIRVSFVGGSPVFAFDEVGTTNVLSPACIVEYDGTFFWPGGARFFIYSGVIRELPNAQNVDYFFDNINMAYRGRCFGFVNPRWGEIWWCYPRGDATECTHAIIYNVRLNTWYDTELPNSGRTCAVPPCMCQFPILGDIRPTGINDAYYRILRHEVGLNELDGVAQNVVRSSFTTPDISLLKAREPISRVIDAVEFEPDFEQSGDLTMTVIGNANSRAPTRTTNTYTITDPNGGVPASEQTIRLKDSHRQIRMKIESNALGGDYRMGAPFLHIQPGDGTSTT